MRGYAPALAFRGELRFPGAIREIRLSLGLTQADFAQKFGLTRIQVISPESGKANPTLETLQKIARPFGFQVGFVPREDATRPPAELLADPIAAHPGEPARRDI